jgi:hypothetical protein
MIAPEELPTIKLQQGCGLRFRELVASEEFHHECLADPTRDIGFLPTKTSEHLFWQLDFKAFFRHGMAPFVYMSLVFVCISSV